MQLVQAYFANGSINPYRYPFGSLTLFAFPIDIISIAFMILQRHKRSVKIEWSILGPVHFTECTAGDA